MSRFAPPLPPGARLFGFVVAADVDAVVRVGVGVGSASVRRARHAMQSGLVRASLSFSGGGGAGCSSRKCRLHAPPNCVCGVAEWCRLVSLLSERVARSAGQQAADKSRLVEPLKSSDSRLSVFISLLAGAKNQKKNEKRKTNKTTTQRGRRSGANTIINFHESVRVESFAGGQLRCAAPEVVWPETIPRLRPRPRPRPRSRLLPQSSRV